MNVVPDLTLMQTHLSTFHLPQQSGKDFLLLRGRGEENQNAQTTFLQLPLSPACTSAPLSSPLPQHLIPHNFLLSGLL